MIPILLLAALPLAISLLTYAFFWYETANSAHRQYLENLSNGRPARLLVKAICSSYFSLLMTVALYPSVLFRRLRQPGIDPDCVAPPIILVHGLYHNPSAWTLYRRWLTAAGFSNIYLFGYSSWNQDFFDLVKRLEELIVRVKERLPDRPPILIGHSLGGLLARACVQSTGESFHLSGVITLGTPHQGSKLAALGVGKLAKSLIYRGPLIKELDQGAPRTNTPCVALYSPVDNMVLPNHSLQIAMAGWIHQETAPVSHVAMLFHKRTAELTIEYLNSMRDVTD
jgi:triacylglycerol esterase/lipase EstA (alpha/beta hydrolase family)